MPHLSPISWILTPILFLTLFIIFISSTWWHQTFLFPNINLPLVSNHLNWNWS